MGDKIKILGIGGSLRKGSYSKAILKAAVNLTPKNAEIEIFEELGEIPPYNQDEETNLPKAVKALKEKIRSSDAILFAIPEYNYSIPGFLKNAIDWASRPHGDNSWAGKPAAIMSSSSGIIGGSRAQYHLRQTFVYLNIFVFNRPEVMVPQVQDKVDGEGNLTDKHTKEKIAELLQALVEWTAKIQGK